MPTAVNPDVLWQVVVDAAGPDAKIVLWSGLGDGDIVASAPLTGDNGYTFDSLSGTVRSVGVTTADGDVVMWTSLEAWRGCTVAGSFEFVDPT